jgi:hypothetical protein
MKKTISIFLVIILLALSTTVFASVIDGDPCPHENTGEYYDYSTTDYTDCVEHAMYGCVIRTHTSYYIRICHDCGRYLSTRESVHITHNMQYK